MKNREQNSEEVNKVYKTKDYTRFNLHSINRDIREEHVKFLTNSMKQDGWLPGSHIIITPNGDVINGQHRLLAAMSLGIEVYYIVEKKANVDTIPKLHKNVRNWRQTDYIESYMKRGFPSYKVLSTFMTNFPELKPTDCIMLCKNSLNSGNRGEIENGIVKLGDVKKAYDWGHKIMSIKPFFPEYYNRAVFVRAMIKIFVKKSDVFVWDEFIHKLRLRPRSLKPCGTVDQYIDLIEEIYNYRRPGGDKISLRCFD